MKALLEFLKFEKATLKYDGLNRMFIIEGPDVHTTFRVRDTDSEEFLTCLIDNVIREASK